MMESLRIQLLKDLINIYADEYASAVFAAESQYRKDLNDKAEATKAALYKFLEENFS